MNTHKQYTMGEARARLTEIVARVLQGETIILTKLNLPLVKVAPLDEDDE